MPWCPWAGCGHSIARHRKRCARLSGSKLSARTSTPWAVLARVLKSALRSRTVGFPESGSDLGRARHLSARGPAHRYGGLSTDSHTPLAPMVCLSPRRKAQGASQVLSDGSCLTGIRFLTPGLRPSPLGSALPRPTPYRAGDLTTRQASLDVTDYSVAQHQTGDVRRWASAPPVSRRHRQPATGPPGSCLDRTATGKRRQSYESAVNTKLTNHLHHWTHKTPKWAS